jgi:hypothetical protein
LTTKIDLHKMACRKCPRPSHDESERNEETMSFTNVDVGFSDKRYSFEGPDFGSMDDLELELLLELSDSTGGPDGDGPDSVDVEDGDMPDALGDDQDEEEDDDTESEKASH